MKLLVVTQKYDTGDSNLGIFVYWWDRFAQVLDRVYVLTLEKRTEPTSSNIQIFSMGKELGSSKITRLTNFYRHFLKTIGDVDAILVHMIPLYIWLAAPVAFAYRKPIYLWYTGVSAHWKLRLAVFFCKKVFTAHEAAMRIDTKKRIITGHGINIEKFKVKSLKLKVDESITILSVGRITPSKGHDLIIKSVSDLIKSGYNLKLKIIGGVIQEYHQKYLESLKKLTSDLKINESVEFSGPVSYEKMPEYLENSEVLINAVPFGGLDKVVLEAMSSGIIPLSSNSAFLNVFPQEVSADLFFKVGDLEDLKNKLKNILDKKLYQNESLRAELRVVVVKNHNLDNLIDKIFKEMKND